MTKLEPAHVCGLHMEPFFLSKKSQHTQSVSVLTFHPEIQIMWSQTTSVVIYIKPFVLPNAIISTPSVCADSSSYTDINSVVTDCCEAE